MTLLVALALTSTGVLDAEQVARRHFERAERFYAVGRFDDALGEYEAAYEAKPLAGFLFNIGQCHRNLGDLKAAVFSFRKYLAAKPDARNRSAVQDLIAELDRRIAAAERQARRPPPTSASHVDLSAAPPGAPGAVGALPRASTAASAPSPVAASPAATPARGPATDRPSRRTALTPAPLAQVERADLFAPTPVPRAPTRPAGSPIYKRWWFWTLVGVAAAGAAAGVYAATANSGTGVPDTSLGNIDFR
jgi:tetratricopeptide (TPR) repeat protein